MSSKEGSTVVAEHQFSGLDLLVEPAIPPVEVEHCKVCGRPVEMMCQQRTGKCSGLCEDVVAGRKTLEQAEAARGTYTRAD